MGAIHLAVISGALLLSLGGGGGAAPPSYTLTAAALNPATVTAGNMSSSLVTVTSSDCFNLTHTPLTFRAIPALMTKRTSGAIAPARL